MLTTIYIDDQELLGPDEWRFLIRLRDRACVQCGATENLHAHHKDRDRSNNSLSNGETLCASCHSTHHITSRDPSWRQTAWAGRREKFGPTGRSGGQAAVNVERAGAMFAAGMSHHDIGKIYGVCGSTVAEALKRGAA